MKDFIQKNIKKFNRKKKERVNNKSYFNEIPNRNIFKFYDGLINKITYLSLFSLSI